MRASYVIIGLLLGMLIVTRHAEVVIHENDKQNGQLLSALSLAVYYEGIERGREMRDGRYLHMALGCYEELAYAKKHITWLMSKGKGQKDWSYKLR